MDITLSQVFKSNRMLVIFQMCGESNLTCRTLFYSAYFYYFLDLIRQVLRSLTLVNVPIQRCKNGPTQAKVLHSKLYI